MQVHDISDSWSYMRLLLSIAVFLFAMPFSAMAADPVRGMDWDWGPEQIQEEGRLIAKTRDTLLVGSETRMYDAYINGHPARVAYQFFEGDLFGIRISFSHNLPVDSKVLIHQFEEINGILKSKYSAGKEAHDWKDDKVNRAKFNWPRAFDEGGLGLRHYWLNGEVEIVQGLPRVSSDHFVWYSHMKRHHRILGIVAKKQRNQL